MAETEHKPDGPVESVPGVNPSEAARDALYADMGAASGGQNHDDTTFQARSSFMFSAILPPPMGNQDKARMAVHQPEPPSPAALDRTPAPPLFGDDRAAWAAFRATRAAVRGWIGEDADQVEPARLADQAVCMADYLRRAPTASDEAVLTQLSMRGKARGGDELLLFKVRIFRAVLAIADKQATAEAEPGPSDAERAAAAPKPDPRELSLKTVKEPLALSETAKGR